MEYEVKLAPMDKSATTPRGLFEPLCNNCVSPDCTNPIKEVEVSVIGILKKQRVYVVNQTVVRQVVSCKGYMGDEMDGISGSNS
jgi:hypothetical protein